MPQHHDVRAEQVNLKRLGAILSLAQERDLHSMEDVLLLEGVGPRTLQSLTLISEVIHGTASRFSDPARFSFAHGGKDGHPFPVPTKVYDESIALLQHAIDKAKIGYNDRSMAIKNLTKVTQQRERDFVPNNSLEELIQYERIHSWKYGGRTVMGKAKPPQLVSQLKLF